MKLTPYQARQCAYEVKDYDNACHRISAETLYLYPPGIPIMVAGEVVNNQVLKIIRFYEEHGMEVKGSCHIKGQLKCIKNDQ